MLRRESDLANNGYNLLAQEQIYQWFGAWISPKWWSDAHINKAVVGLLAAQTSLEVGTTYWIRRCAPTQHHSISP